tara:strand:- start:120 stop:785 length:666 start_codon:yes stop_codon:yes gene_type:complete
MKLNKKIKFVCAADGTSGSGKTTATKIISDHFGLKLLSSGLLYRWIALQLIIKNKSINDKEFLLQISKKISLRKLKNKKLYSPTVTEFTSKIAKIKFIRLLLKNFQKKFSQKRLCIIEGRDIGTVVVKNADLKLFFKCSLNTKAKRRFKEYKKNNSKITYEQVKKALKLRDFRDANRKISPCRPAKGAVIVDTSKINIKQMKVKLINIVFKELQKKYGRNL